MVMASLAVVCALAMAACIGYHLGRRTGATPSFRKRRTSRIAIGARGLSLLMLVAERRVRSRIRTARWSSAVLGWGVPTALELLRGHLARARP